MVDRRARLASMSSLPAANDPQTSAAAIRVQAIARGRLARQAVAAGNPAAKRPRPATTQAHTLQV